MADPHGPRCRGGRGASLHGGWLSLPATANRVNGRRRNLGGTNTPDVLLPRTEPVEISTRMRPGEWTEESLQAHIEDYRQQIRNMGATDAEIVTNVERTDEGAARVVVSWNRTGL
ncbi:hypothetical protein AAHB34_18560 [Paenarthrobacter ureafaciens]